MSILLLSLWTRIPVVVRAIVSGLVLASVVTVPWAMLVSLNLQHGSVVPWAVPPTLVYLWLWWRYVSGRGWPRATSLARRANLRAVPVPDDAWPAALVAGMLGLSTAVLISSVMRRLASMTDPPLPDISHVPFPTLLCFQLTSAAVAGIVEESSFRGYMQAPIERRHGPVLAILITAGMFALAHTQNASFAWGQMPFYLAVAGTFCMLAYLTNSILPGMVLHVSAVAMDGIGQLARADQMRQPASPPPTIWQTGADASFWMSCLIATIMAIATIAAYVMLARTMQQAMTGASDGPQASRDVPFLE